MDVKRRTPVAAGPGHPVVRFFVHAYGVVGGMAAWMVHLSVAEGMVGLECRRGDRLALHGLTLVAGLVAAGAVIVANRVWRRAVASGGDAAGYGVWPRDAFLGMLGMLLSTIGLALIVFEGLPVFAISPCRP